MGEVQATLTVFFEDPFWVGVIERIEDGKLSAAKVTFGAEPKDNEVLGLLIKNYGSFRFSPAVSAVVGRTNANPKKLQRDIGRQLHKTGVGTRSQQALKLQQEQNKQTRKAQSRAEKQAEAERMFAQKQQKKKAKHRGR